MSATGHRGGAVRPAAAEPPDGARVEPTGTLRRGEPAGFCLGPAAECGPEAGNESHHSGKYETINFITWHITQEERLLANSSKQP